MTEENLGAEKVDRGTIADTSGSPGDSRKESRKACDMADLRRRWLTGGACFVIFFAVQSGWATEAPADPCSLLPSAAVSKSLGQNYGAAQKSVAPRPYKNSVTGTDCTYSPDRAGKDLLFRVYFDASAADATGLFAKLKIFYSPPTAVPGIADEAYSDPRHGLHVRKGNVRFFLSLGNGDDFTPANQAQLTNLAGQIAGQL